MNFRTFLLAAASVAAIAPSISRAAPENVALSACARAFAASMAAPGASAPTFKVKYLNTHRGSAVDDYYSGAEYTFYLQAHNSKTGLTIASATCVTDGRGSHIALTTTPSDAREVELAARF